MLFLRIIGWQTEALGAQLSLSWNASSTNELGFSIERSTGTTGAFGEIARTGPGVTTYSDPGLADATTYCYRVRAFNATTYSDYSNPACATNVSLGLSLSRHTVSPGDTVQVSVTEANTGEATSVELYFGILVPLALSSTYGCPDGDAVVFIADGFSKVLTPCVNTASPASVEPLYSDVSLPTAMPATTTLDLVSFTWPTEVPEGMYTFVIFAAPAGTYANGGLSADVISAVASDSLQASP